MKGGWTYEARLGNMTKNDKRRRKDENEAIFTVSHG
jgi:hypothetical protein